jgi:hypothetical protein
MQAGKIKKQLTEAENNVILSGHRVSFRQNDF